LIRFILRALGLAALALAFAACVIDGARSIAAGQISLTKTGESIYLALPDKLPLFQNFVVRQIHPLLWDPILVDLLMAPTFLVLSIVGVGLFYATRRRPPPIGHSNRSR
jgi:hypothetical protein